MIAVISAVLLEEAVVLEKAGWVSLVTTGPNMISIDLRGDLATTFHPANVSPFTLRVPPSEKIAHPLKSLPLSRIAERAMGRCGYLALGLSRRNRRQVSFWTCRLVCMGISMSDGSHKAGKQHQEEDGFFVVASQPVSTVKKVSRTIEGIHHNGRGSRVHPGIQHDTCVPVHHCGSFGQCTSHCREHAAYQQPALDEMH